MQYRQGDLLFVAVGSVNPKAKKQKDNIIALGEVTGHTHSLEEGEVLKAGSLKYLALAKASKVVHQEHNPIELPKGNYQVLRQREYKPAKRKAVMVVD